MRIVATVSLGREPRPVREKRDGSLRDGLVEEWDVEDAVVTIGIEPVA